jgi:hypothetical protein
MRHRPILSIVLTSGMVAASCFLPAVARDRSTPDWPCIQRKIDNLTSTQVWSGPAVEDMNGWHEPAVEQLVAKLANRRTPVKDAESELAKFAAGLPEAARVERLTLVFAGVFQTLFRSRADVMKGLEKHLRAQRERAAEIERLGTEVANLEEQAESAAVPPAALEEARTRFDMAQRIFDERQSNIPLACEVPVRIDQRIFTLGKAIDELIAQYATASAAVTAPVP